MERLSKRINTTEEEQELLEKIESFIRQYEMSKHLDLVDINPVICESLNLTRDKMAEMSGEDVLHHAYVISTHVTKLTVYFNEEKAKMAFIKAAFSDGLNHYLATEPFPPYTTKETKEQIICEKYEIVHKTRELLRKIETTIQLYDDKFYSLKKLIDILYQLARTK
jgi:hypothetical protein